MIDTSKKATMATIKSFVRKNRAKLLIKVVSSFDGMCDVVRKCDDTDYSPVVETGFPENTLGIRGAWFVGNSRDSISPFVEGGLEGYKIYNSCGSFSLAVTS